MLTHPKNYKNFEVSNGLVFLQACAYPTSRLVNEEYERF